MSKRPKLVFSPDPKLDESQNWGPGFWKKRCEVLRQQLDDALHYKGMYEQSVGGDHERTVKLCNRIRRNSSVYNNINRMLVRQNETISVLCRACPEGVQALIMDLLRCNNEGMKLLSDAAGDNDALISPPHWAPEV